MHELLLGNILVHAVHPQVGLRFFSVLGMLLAMVAVKSYGGRGVCRGRNMIVLAAAIFSEAARAKAEESARSGDPVSARTPLGILPLRGSNVAERDHVGKVVPSCVGEQVGLIGDETVGGALHLLVENLDFNQFSNANLQGIEAGTNFGVDRKVQLRRLADWVAGNILRNSRRAWSGLQLFLHRQLRPPAIPRSSLHNERCGNRRSTRVSIASATKDREVGDDLVDNHRGQRAVMNINSIVPHHQKSPGTTTGSGLRHVSSSRKKTTHVSLKASVARGTLLTKVRCPRIRIILLT